VNTDKPYAISGSTQSEQAEASTENPAAGNVQMRILIELQVISMLLLNNVGTAAEDLRQMRQNAADSIT
jgi:hypothetical protein